MLAFNSIEWIQYRDIVEIPAPKQIFSFNSIEWIRKRRPATRGYRKRPLSIPLNGFFDPKVGAVTQHTVPLSIPLNGFLYHLTSVSPAELNSTFQFH